MLRRAPDWPRPCNASAGLAVIGQGYDLPNAGIHLCPLRQYFDIDGTLVDSNDMHVTAWEEAFAKIDRHFEREVIHNL
jgi:hypothetical protein